MTRWRYPLIAIAASVTILVALWLAFTTTMVNAPSALPCSKEWFSQIESQLPTDDGEGHGPDQGDPEWFHVIERWIKLNDGGFKTDQVRCDAIQSQLEHHVVIVNVELGGALVL
jgi:hypothetical protein